MQFLLLDFGVIAFIISIISITFHKIKLKTTAFKPINN